MIGHSTLRSYRAEHRNFGDCRQRIVADHRMINVCSGGPVLQSQATLL
jgi:hypothetical protein